MFKNGMRPVHPGEVLREDYLKPLDTHTVFEHVFLLLMAVSGNPQSPRW